MTNNTMSEEELRKLLEDSGWKFYEELKGWRKESRYTIPMFSADQSTNYDELSAGNYYELMQAIHSYTLSKQIEAQKQVLNLLEANLSLAGWGDDISARKLWANMNQLRKQQEELK